MPVSVLLLYSYVSKKQYTLRCCLKSLHKFYANVNITIWNILLLTFLFLDFMLFVFRFIGVHTCRCSYMLINVKCNSCIFFWSTVDLSSAVAWGKRICLQCRSHRRHRYSLWSGRSPGRGHGNSLQYSRLENSKDRGAWQATTQRAAKSWTWRKWLSMHTQLTY